MEEYLQIYRMVLCNVPKEESFIPLTPELEQTWDEIEARIDPNLGYDVPSEWPDLTGHTFNYATPEEAAALQARFSRSREVGGESS